jgi:hypothetical protein
MTTKFFTFDQNNSGGFFHTTEKLTCYVIIEAENAEQATIKATSLGIYFDGCATGKDCDCCGDRWYRPWDGDGDDVPLVAGRAPAEYLKKWPYRNAEPGREIVVHYADGRVEWF